MSGSNLLRLRVLGYLEGISFLLLLSIGMPLKYLYGIREPNLVIGMLHGILFMAYCTWVYFVQSEQKWSLSKTGWAVVAALLPFGTFAADMKLFRSK